MPEKDPTKADDQRLGLDRAITRRDFLNSSLLGAGSSLLGSMCPAHAMGLLGGAKVTPDAFTGYGGVGDYAAANGNTLPVVEAAHRVRDGVYRTAEMHAADTGESFDLIVVGGGLTGLMAAYQYAKKSGGAKRCLVLENHAIFGGEARQNEFEIDGYRLMAPQGSNDFFPPPEGAGTQMDEFFRDTQLPRSYTFQQWDASLKPLRFSYDNYANMDGFGECGLDVGYFFDQRSGAAGPTWLKNIWSNELRETPFSPAVRQDLLRWRADAGKGATDAQQRALDAVDYRHYLEQEKGFRPEVTRFSQPMVGLLGGVSCDAVSARVGHSLVTQYSTTPRLTLSFPGGNSTMARHLVKAMIPEAIGGAFTFDGVMDGGVNSAALDRPGQPTRIRLRSMVSHVQHEGTGESERVAVTYERGGRLHRIHARAVVMASGGWVNRRVLADLPPETHAAYDTFCYAPALIANVLLTNWRFLYKLGAPAVRWMDDGTMFGYCANVRRNMVIGRYDSPLHPDKPTVLTFYMGLYTPGMPAREQGIAGRARMLGTSYADYERTIRQQMTAMFGGLGFDARRDIGGIILNRWGHARVIQPPGWYFGRDGAPAPREVVRKGYGRIILAHAELNGSQNATGAFQHGHRAADEALALT